MSKKPPKAVSGIAVLLAMVRAADPVFRQQILAKLAVVAPLLAKAAERFLFVYADLQRLDDRGLQLALRSIGERDWLEAWKLTDAVLQKRLLANMSQSRQRDFLQAAASLPKMPKAKVVRAQLRIAHQVEALVSAGKIKMHSKPR